VTERSKRKARRINDAQRARRVSVFEARDKPRRCLIQRVPNG
jgi:hypothetical protein